MRHLLLTLLLVPLLIVPAAFADDTATTEDAARRAELTRSVAHYEEMLRDAKTETAARYFLARLTGFQQALAALDKGVAPGQAKPGKPAKPAKSEVPALTAHADDWLRARIRAKVQEKDIGLTDVTAWTRRELPDAMVAMLSTWLGKDKPLSREAAEKAWHARPRKGWLTAVYGSGTFIVRPPPIKAPRRDAKARLPKPPTRDQWWARASVAEKTDFILAFFVENAGLFEVSNPKKVTRCTTCRGTGIVKKPLPSGVTLDHLCPRCAGTGKDVAVRYR